MIVGVIKLDLAPHLQVLFLLCLTVPLFLSQLEVSVTGGFSEGFAVSFMSVLGLGQEVVQMLVLLMDQFVTMFLVLFN